MPGDSRLKPSTQRAFGSRKKRAWNKKAPATSAPSAAELESRPDPLDLPGTSTDDTVGPSSTSETLRVDAAYYSTAEQAQRVERSAQTKTVLSGKSATQRNQVTAAQGVANVQGGRSLTASQLQAMRQGNFLRQQQQQQQRMQATVAVPVSLAAGTAKVAVSAAVQQARPLSQQQQQQQASTAQQQQAQQQQQAVAAAVAAVKAATPLGTAKQQTAITRNLTEAEMAQLLKRRELQQKQVRAQRTVSAPSALGPSQTAVTIPVSAVTMAGVNINVSLAQAQLPTGKAPTVATQLGTVQIVQQGSGQGAKATTLPSATAITVQQIIKQVLPVNQNFLVSSAVQSAAGGSSSGATTVSPATQVQLHAMLHKPAVSTVALAAPTAASSGATAATLVPTRIMALQQPPGQPTAVALKQGLQVIAASAGTAQTSSYTVEGSAAAPLVASIVADAAALKPVEGGTLPKAIAVAVTTATAGTDNSVVPPNVTAPSSTETITRAVSVDVSAATVQAVQAAIEAARQQGSLPYTMRLRNNPPKPA
ncbi:hypothetical protein HPB52_015293 [Rhipicephalus sanguineus]|uniref:Uncharacterized protein n=1 Tax=Rhipicephalus sanguineus TaxID=34632 RepID=A0A9D4PXS5_RHISA|nr:hypothetical protein HPB52_015293 [Rhipicephalus sanguineus]